MFLFRLIFLPLTILRSLFGLVGLTSGIGFFFLRLIVRNIFVIGLVIVALLIYNSFKRDPDQLKQLQPGPTQQGPKGVPPVIEPVTKREDGDSLFATDLYKLMNETERQQYSAAYYTTMSSKPDGQPASWSFYNIHGTITPMRTFTNKVGETCREFREVLKVKHIEQTLTGTACPNGKGSWCKLKPNATPGCGLGGHKPGMFDGVTDSLKNLF